MRNAMQYIRCIRRKRQWGASFLSDQTGSIAVLFALLLVVLAGGMAAAIDVAMAFKTRSAMQAALDSATLAAARNGKAEVARSIADADYQSNTSNGKISSFGLTYTASDVVASATASADVKTYFMALFGMQKLDVSVSSSASAPRKIKSVEFLPTYGQGWWEKTVKLMVLRPGSTTPEEIANIHYKVSNAKPPPRGQLVTEPHGWVDLGDYTYAYLEMTIGPRAFEFDKFCPGCPKVLRSDDPATSDRFYIDGKQVPKGTKLNIFDIVKCGDSSEQEWEDGGGGETDIRYTIQTTCDDASDGSVVHLVK